MACLFLESPSAGVSRQPRTYIRWWFMSLLKLRIQPRSLICVVYITRTPMQLRALLQEKTKQPVGRISCDWVIRLMDKRSTSVIVRSGVFKAERQTAKRLTKQRSAHVHPSRVHRRWENGRRGGILSVYLVFPATGFSTTNRDSGGGWRKSSAECEC